MYIKITPDEIAFVVPIGEWLRVPEGDRTPVVSPEWIEEFGRPVTLAESTLDAMRMHRSVAERLRPPWEAFARAVEWLLKEDKL